MPLSAGGLMAFCAGGAVLPGPGGAGGVPGAGLVAAAVVRAVVVVKSVSVGPLEAPFGADFRGVLDLLLGDGQPKLPVTRLGAVKRGEAFPGTEQARAGGDPLGLARLVVQVGLPAFSDLATVGVGRGRASQVLPLLLRDGRDVPLRYARD